MTPRIRPRDTIQIGKWLHDEQPEPDLARRGVRRNGRSPRRLAKAGDPVTVERELLKSGHTIIRGMTGSGKTSKGMLPLILKLMEPYQLSWPAKNGTLETAHERDAILVVDLGGDKQMFHATQKRALQLGRTFRCFSLDSARSHRFDPFQSIGADGQRIIRLCNLFLEAFSLDHGIIYGGSWYSQRNLLMLLKICEEMVESKRSGREITLKEVDRYLQSSKCADVKDAEQIRGIFRFLLEYDQLQPEPGEPDLIDLKRAIEDGEVIYAYLPAISEATTARQIAGLFLQIAIASAMKIYEERQGSARPQRHLHCFVDEMVNLAGASFENYLIGARKYSISITMAYQSSESLQKDKNVDLVPVVRDNSVLQMLFTVTGRRDIEELQTFSRETTRPLRSRSLETSIRFGAYRALGGESESESVTPQLSKDDILDVAGTEGAFFAVIRDGRGHREPIPAVGAYAVSHAEYLDSLATPLPLVERRVAAAATNRTQRPAGPAWHVAHIEANKPKIHRERLQRLAALLNRLDREEQLEL
ncbi:MAG: hypothetical protein CMJ58_25580 [Planctomycetaceae bacterium]|nr:hypothetical protein [Planctomycetaceae bacterium]